MLTTTPPLSKALVSILRARAETTPDAIAFRFLSDGTTEAATMSYATLDERARAIASTLAMRAKPSSRALLLYPSGVEFVAAFFGCLYAGVVAVPVYPPTSTRLVARLDSIARDASPELVLCGGEMEPLRSKLSGCEGFAALPLINTERECQSTEGFRAVDLSPDRIAFLQYTSGSTSTPKGVMVSHGNLHANAVALAEAFGVTRDSVLVSWLPLYHDMGLMGTVLQSVFSGGSCILMAPAAFLQKPVRWLRALSNYGGTHSAAPSFAYDLCVDRISLEESAGIDLSRWQCTANGAEPVRARTIARFVDRFSQNGFREKVFRPCYGLAEATLLVAAESTAPITLEVDAKELEQHRAVSAAQGGRTLVACGDVGTVPATRIAIVDTTTATEIQSDAVGEIWVRAPQVAQGYLNKTEETQQTFNARLADTNEGPFLRTGDLGFVRDGRLFVTGRLKDLLILHGQNHYPQDIEGTAEASHPAIEPGHAAAFALDVAGTERLAVAVEVRREGLRTLNTDEVIAKVCRSIAAQHELPVHALVLVKPGALPRTSSGKVRRSATRDAFVRGELKTIASFHADSGSHSEKPAPAPASAPRPVAADSSQLQAWLREQLATLLELDARSVSANALFTQLGLSSVRAVELSVLLSEHLGSHVPPTIFFEHPTVAELAAALAESAADARVGADTTKVAQAPPAERDDIAIVGMACRFPGAPDLDAYFQLLCSEKDAVTRVPEDRWRSTDGSVPAGVAGYRAGLLDDVLGFDAPYFGISSNEAVAMDPQQRLLLEVTQEAIDDAGIRAEALRGSDTGVFVGFSTSEYAAMFTASNAPINSHTATGCFGAVAANRISYLYDLRGPSYTVDAVCSSGLLAVHLACQNIQSGECEQALVGGVVLMLTKSGADWFGELGVTSPRGRCRAFAASADGIVLGEGVAALVLKRASKARADGDRIYAIVRGSAATQDGRTNGLTAPTQRSQEKMLRTAYARAGVRSDDVTYVDAHGTGTVLGDPIEAQALGAVLGAERGPENPLLIGSVKTNIGHCSIVGGLASLIKVALSIHHRVLPASLHFDAPNPHIAFESLGLKVVDRTMPWPDRPGPALGGVTALSFGGTNVHVVVAGAEQPGPSGSFDHDRAHLLVASAKSPLALSRLVEKYRELAAQESTSWPDVCYSAALRRSHHRHRMAVAFRSGPELVSALTAWLDAKERGSTARDRPHDRSSPHDSAELARLAREGERYVAGADVDFEALFQPGRKLVSLPSYPWEHQRYWPAFANTREAVPTERIDAPGSTASTATTSSWSEEALRAWLREQTAETLQVPADSLSHDRPLSEQGFNSLNALELSEKLREIGMDAPFDLLLQGPSVADLAHALLVPGATPTSSADLDWRVETKLDAQIVPAPSTGRRNSAYQRVVLTGATGFLGAFLAHELLSQTRAHVLCVVRARNEVQGRERLESNLRRYGLWKDEYHARLEPVLGELSDARLGLPEARFEELSRTTDAVYHNGAQVTYALRYQDLRATNVHGTQEACRLAAAGRSKPLHFVSSMGVLFPPRAEVLHEDTALDSVAGHRLGYLQSKWACEKMLEQARQRGVPVSTYRPAWIGGSSTSGACNMEDFLYQFIKGIIELGAAPRVRHPLDVVPVDLMARGIISLSLESGALGKNFNLAHPNPSTLEDWVVRLERAGYRIELEPLAKWKERLRDRCDSTNPLFPLRSLFLDEAPELGSTLYEYYFPHDFKATVSCANTDAHFAREPGRWAQMAAGDPFETIVAHLIESGFIRAP